MPFSVGTNWDDAIVDELAALHEVRDFYGALPLGAIGHGRPAVSVPAISKDDARRHIRRIHDAGRTFTYLINSPSLGGREMLARERRQILELLAWVSDAGADAVTVAFPSLLEIVRTRFSYLKAKISHNATVLTVEDALHWQALGADMICLHRCTHRNFPLLSLLVAALRIPLQAIVTSGCVFGCPNQSSLYHMSITASQSTAGRTASAEARHGQGYCFSWCHRAKLQHPVELVKSAFIRPEDLEVYEEIGIKEFKLDTRVLDTPSLAARVKAYHSRRFDGNFQALFSAFPLAYRTRVGTQMGAGPASRTGAADEALARFQDAGAPPRNGPDPCTDAERCPACPSPVPAAPRRSPSAAPIPLLWMDNRALDGFVRRFLNHPCPPSCKDCHYCAAFARTALRFNEPRRSEFLSILSEYHTWLADGQPATPKPRQRGH